jgi:hypothetical protein
MPPKKKKAPAKSKAPTGSTTGRRGAGSQVVKQDTYKTPQKRAKMQTRRRKVCNGMTPKRYPTRGGTNYNKNRTVQNYSCSNYAKRKPRGPRAYHRKDPQHRAKAVRAQQDEYDRSMAAQTLQGRFRASSRGQDARRKAAGGTFKRGITTKSTKRTTKTGFGIRRTPAKKTPAKKATPKKTVPVAAHTRRVTRSSTR